VLFDGDVVAGVETTDGRRIDARAVVSTLNPVQTFGGLVEDGRLGDDLRASVQSWEWEERSLFGLHLGIRGGVRYRARDPRVGEAMIVFCGPESDDELCGHLSRVDCGEAVRCEWLHVTVPSRFDATMAPKGHSTLRAESVVRYDPRWPTKAESFADSCLELLGQYAEIDEIVLRRCFTPVDIEQKLTTMKLGSIKHGAYTPLQMGFLRPNDLCSRSETPVPGLFLGGASMYPGGMILGGPGYIAAGVVEGYLGATAAE
jgi:phytoene dehydrogenase-like protein